MTRRPITRRRFLGTGAALAGGGLLVPRGAWARPTAAQEAVELEVFVHANHPFDDVKPLFEERYPNFTLNMLENNDVPTFRATLAADGEGTPDLLWPEIELVQELGKTGVLLDVTDLVDKLKADLAPGKLAECFIPSTGRYAAFPGDVAVVGLYYREDLFGQAGVTLPADPTWDEFIELSRKIRQDTGAYTMFFPTDGTRDTAILWSYFLCQLGGSITNADGTQVTLDDEKGVAAMRLVKQVWDADIAVQDSPLLETYFAAVAGNQVAAMPMPVWYRGFGLEPYATSAEEGGAGRWRVALLPRPAPEAVRTANFGGAAIASTRYTAHPEEVKAFMEFALGSMEGSTACGQWGILPPYLPYLRSEAWRGVRSPAFGDFAFNDVWTQAVEQYPGTWYKQPVFAEAMIEVGAQTMAMVQGEVEIEPGMKAVGDRVRELNQRYQG
jgi:ABC-type glycerol-3-phosphate transport system substrate-binding protein